MSESEDYGDEVRSELDSQDWAEIIPRLHEYALRKSRKYFYLGAAIEAEEIVSEAIACVYGVGNNDNYRNWNRDKYPDLVDFMFSVIDSIVNRRVDHSMRFKSIEIDNPNTGQSYIPKNVDTPEEEFIRIESRKGIIDKIKVPPAFKYQLCLCRIDKLQNLRSCGFHFHC